MRKSLEARNITDNERILQLEKGIGESQIIAEDAERRFDEVNFVIIYFIKLYIKVKLSFI